MMREAKAYQTRMQSRQPPELLCRLDQVDLLHGTVAFPFELDLGLAREQRRNGVRIGFLPERQVQPHYLIRAPVRTAYQRLLELDEAGVEFRAIHPCSGRSEASELQVLSGSDC